MEKFSLLDGKSKNFKCFPLKISNAERTAGFIGFNLPEGEGGAGVIFRPRKTSRPDQTAETVPFRDWLGRIERNLFPFPFPGFLNKGGTL